MVLQNRYRYHTVYLCFLPMFPNLSHFSSGTYRYLPYLPCFRFMFSTMDVNRDGRICRKEIKTAFQRMGIFIR